MLLKRLSLPPSFTCAPNAFTHTLPLSLSLSLSLTCQMPNSRRGVMFLHCHRGYIGHKHTRAQTWILIFRKCQPFKMK